MELHDTNTNKDACLKREKDQEIGNLLERLSVKANKDSNWKEVYGTILGTSKEILFAKEGEIKNMTIKILNEQLKKQLNNVSEQPGDILKRLLKYADKFEQEYEYEESLQV